MACIELPWISINHEYPPTKICGYGGTEMGSCVFVKSEYGRGFGYPFIAHLHKEPLSNQYLLYAWGIDKNGFRFTWLNPHLDIRYLQNITHWCAINQAKENV